MSFGTYLRFSPFIEDEDDVIAITAQLSLYFSLFASLLVKLEVSKSSDPFLFGCVMISLNIAAVCLTLLYFFARPIAKIFKLLSKKHKHDAPIKGLGPDEESREGFEAFFSRLALSEKEEAGWETVKEQHFSETMKEVLGRVGAVCEWRCATGDGPIDTCRVRICIEAELSEVIALTLKLGGVDNIEQYIGEKISEGHDKVYTAIKLPLFFANRDFIVERFYGICSDGTFCTVNRSIIDNHIKTSKDSKRLNRVRAEVKIGGYMLREIGGASRGDSPFQH